MAGAKRLIGGGLNRDVIPNFLETLQGLGEDSDVHFGTTRRRRQREGQRGGVLCRIWYGGSLMIGDGRVIERDT